MQAAIPQVELSTVIRYSRTAPGTIPFIFVIIERKLRVFSFAELALCSVVYFHELRCVAVNGQLPAHRFKKLNVNRQRCEPFLAANNVRCAHKVVVDNMRKMIRRDSVRLKQNNILVVYRHCELAADSVLNRERFSAWLGCTKAQHKRLSFVNILFCSLKRNISVHCPFP